MRETTRLSIFFLLLLSGCATAQGDLKFCDSWSGLYDSLEQQDGQEVVLYGWFSAEFEVCALRSPDGKHELWVVPADNEPTLCTLEQAVLDPIHEWAEVTGVFKYGASYGHLGTYSAALANAKIDLAASKNEGACTTVAEIPAD